MEHSTRARSQVLNEDAPFAAIAAGPFQHRFHSSFEVSIIEVGELFFLAFPLISILRSSRPPPSVMVEVEVLLQYVLKPSPWMAGLPMSTGGPIESSLSPSPVISSCDVPCPSEESASLFINPIRKADLFQCVQCFPGHSPLPLHPAFPHHLVINLIVFF